MSDNYVHVALGPTANMGWECPVCHKCYSPSVVQCYTCGEPITTVSFPPNNPQSDPLGVCYACGIKHWPGDPCPKPGSTQFMDDPKGA
jgi:hypothetical protein